MRTVESQQVSWWSVHEFVVPKLEKAGDWPRAGTPLWRLLEDRDPAKWAAVLDDAQHWALKLETAQEALCEASHDLAGAADWSAANRYVTGHKAFYAARPWLKRRAS
jgi:hypothetical protein